ncbi:MAG: M48 family metalloprotease [Candidatus Rokuibacteriota bacterium]
MEHGFALSKNADRRTEAPGGPTRRRVLQGLGAALLGGVPTACAVNPVSGRSELMLMSEAEELELGRKVFAQLAWQDGGPLRIDRETQSYLDGIVRRLHQVSHRPGLPVDFTLESASEPNAWAIPGYTAMNRGLLQHLESEAQFAFVMGHEMGHVAARHSAQRQSRATVGGGAVGVLGVAADVLGLGALGDLAVGAAGVGTQILLLSYDRGQELQADQLGALYMARAGYDPREAVRSHEVLNRAIDLHLANLGKTRRDPGTMAQILSTHPRHEERVSEIAAYIRTLAPADVRIQDDGRMADRWLRQTGPVRRLAPAYARYDRARLAFGQAAQAAERRDGRVVQQKLAEAEREIEQAIQLADQAQFATLQGYILAAQGRRADARGAFNRAVGMYPGYQPAVRALARIGR